MLSDTVPVSSPFSAVVHPGEGWMQITQPTTELTRRATGRKTITDSHYWTTADLTTDDAAAILDALGFCPVEIWRQTDESSGRYWAPLFRKPNTDPEQGELFS